MKTSAALVALSLAVLTVTLADAAAKQEAGRGRNGKFLSMFNVIQFPNDECEGDTGKNGTCYTAPECDLRQGTSTGGCADGYGVCCTFVRNCGITTNENNTYFESDGSETGACTLKVCKANANVCQLRLDFNTFNIAQPSSETASSGLFNTHAYTDRSVCTNDQFIVTSPGNPTPPVICGQNSLQHMYVDSSALCNDLTFVIGQQAASTMRQWEIKVTQYTCNFDNRAPSGCTQYFFSETGMGTFQTYNFQGGQHLANQRHKFCFRRERGMCRICFSQAALGDFETSGAAKATVPGQKSSCCGYGNAGSAAASAYDCLVIPNAVTEDGVPAHSGVSEYCGSHVKISTTISTISNVKGFQNGAIASSICSTRLPFEATFYSDGFEFAGVEAVEAQAGVKLDFKQDGTTC